MSRDTLTSETLHALRLPHRSSGVLRSVYGPILTLKDATDRFSRNLGN